MAYGFAPYVSVAKRREKAAKAVAKLAKKGQKITPIEIEGRKIAQTFWGKGWCTHLESFSDFANRLPRGRTYVRNGSVVHLAVEKGLVTALVQGTELYKVRIEVKSVEQKKWQALLQRCSGQIDSVIELLQGRLSSGVMSSITDQKNGLFPHPDEIKLSCSCPDWADMCKHVAAVLYGVGARLDHEPEILFTLRHCDHFELISQASLQTSSQPSAKSVVLEDQDLSDLFGIEVEASPRKEGAGRSSPQKDRGKDKAKPAAIKKKSVASTKKKTTKKLVR